MKALLATEGAWGAAWWFVKFSVSVAAIWLLIYLAIWMFIGGIGVMLLGLLGSIH